MTPPSYRRQRGAVTLAGAMFLIVTIVVMLGVAQRMAATDITDTALQSDGVEALFLAETGLERAAYRYANGTACGAIAGETDTAGRGSFLILTSVFVDPICRVRVAGSVVTTTAANTVTRTVEGDLLLTGFRGWAVGERAGGQAVLLAWDGAAWTRPGPYPGIANRDLFGVYCVTEDDCWAVGQRSNGFENINRWDGTAWSRLPNLPGIPNQNLNSVYCVASDDCWAVGDNGGGGELMIHWNGATWSRDGPYGGIPNRDLHSVHCVDSDNCWAVGQRQGGNNTEIIIYWDGVASTWSRQGPYGNVPNQDLNGVYCVATDDCWAVGRRDGDANISRWDNGVPDWNRDVTIFDSSGPDRVRNQHLNGVTCVATNFCWAVGRRSNGRENINFWDGAIWRRWPNTTIANRHLNAVQMVDGTEGYIVGENGTMGVWDGAAWTGQASPVTRDLYSVSVVAEP